MHTAAPLPPLILRGLVDRRRILLSVSAGKTALRAKGFDGAAEEADPAYWLRAPGPHAFLWSPRICPSSLVPHHCRWCLDRIRSGPFYNEPIPLTPRLPLFRPFVSASLQEDRLHPFKGVDFTLLCLELFP